jgi:O-antigen biosynthesis protein
MIEFTGERYVPIVSGKIRLEHYHRYLSVLNHVRDKSVLDVACGEGYGSDLIAKYAESVIGVDLSEEAIKHATSAYCKANLQFEHGSVLDLPFRNETFDVVISFETIEHLVEQSQMLDEILRVMKTDGLLIISSPNRDVYADEDGQHNEFHLKELNFDEFNGLLSDRFSKIQYAGQRVIASSYIDSITVRQNSAAVYSDNQGCFAIGTQPLSSYVYYVAYCTNRKNGIVPPETSFAISTDNELMQQYVALGKWAESQNSEIDKKNSRILELQDELEERTKWAFDLKDELSLKADAILILERNLASLKLPRAKWYKDLYNSIKRIAKKCLK